MKFIPLYSIWSDLLKKLYNNWGCMGTFAARIDNIRFRVDLHKRAPSQEMP